MKKIIIMFLVFFSLGVAAQTTRVGNTFIVSSSSSKDTIVTNYTYYYNGRPYPIIVNRTSGAVYVWRYNSKGKLTRDYKLRPGIADTVRKELGIKKRER